MLKGNLSSFSLGEIFQSLAINKRTGTLTIQSGGSAKHIYFVDGSVRFFSHGTPRTPRIGEVLVRSGRLSREQLQEALEESSSTDKLLGRILLEGGYLAEDDIREALTMKVCEELYELFAWTEGDFEFKEDHCPEEIFDALQRSVNLTLSTNSVIMEGLRRIDEWQLIHSRIRTSNEIFTSTGKPLPKDDPSLTNVLQWIDGKRPVHALAHEYPGPKFVLLKGIYELLEAGVLRPRTPEELSQAAQTAKEARDYEEAATYLRFAVEQKTDSPELFVELGDVLGRFYQERESEQAFLRALKLLYHQGDWDKVGEVAERLSPKTELNPSDLKMLLTIFVELKLVKKALWAGQQLATKLQNDGQAKEAAEVLDSLVALDPDDLNLRVQIAALLEKVGQTDRAIAYYEEVAEQLEQQKKIKDQIKILRLIVELDPKRVELKQKISTLNALQERLERQRKRRLTIGGSAVILLIAVSVIPLVYEIKARELYNAARSALETGEATNDYGQAKRRYEQLLANYGWSSKADNARLDLERIEQIEENLDSQTRSRLENERREQAERREALETRIAKALEDARRLEKLGRIEAAHQRYREAMELGRTTLTLHKIQLPVLIETSPSGAEVVVDGRVVGTTPLIWKYDPGQEVDIELVRKGCHPVEETLVLRDQHRLSWKLHRRPLAEHLLPSDFREAPVEAGVRDLVLFSSRDGYLYAYDPSRQGVLWKKKVGRFGDRISALHVREGHVYAGTVEDSLLSFHVRTGKPKWPPRPLRGPVLAAPATSADTRWLAVANAYGEVYLIDDRTGRIENRFATENEVVASPIFANGLLLVGSRDSYVYAYDIEREVVTFLLELPDEIDIDPVRYGSDAVFATRDGSVHRVDTERQTTAWSVRVTSEQVVSLLSTNERILVALSSGEVLSLDPPTGQVADHWKIHSSEPGGMCLANGRLYTGYLDGTVVAWDIQRAAVDWSWRADSSIGSPPLVLDDKLFVACNTGTMQVLELLD